MYPKCLKYENFMNASHMVTIVFNSPRPIYLLHLTVVHFPQMSFNHNAMLLWKDIHFNEANNY